MMAYAQSMRSNQASAWSRMANNAHVLVWNFDAWSVGLELVKAFFAFKRICARRISLPSNPNP